MKTENYNNKTFFFENNTSEKLIIFSHGFGVRWDSKGLFTDIAKSLPGFDFIFFDYYKIDEKENWYVDSVSEQIEVFKNIIKFAGSKNYSEINIITHSFGMVPPLTLNPKSINKLILLAPPTWLSKERYLRRLREREGSEVNFEGYSKLVRFDGKFIFLNHTFLESVDNIDFFGMLNSSSAKAKYIIMALNDETIDNDYTLGKLNSDIKKIDLQGDHSFKGDARIGLTEQIKEILA